MVLNAVHISDFLLVLSTDLIISWGPFTYQCKHTDVCDDTAVSTISGVEKRWIHTFSRWNAILSRIWTRLIEPISYDDKRYAICASGLCFVSPISFLKLWKVYFYPKPHREQDATQGQFSAEYILIKFRVFLLLNSLPLQN